MLRTWAQSGRLKQVTERIWEDASALLELALGAKARFRVQKALGLSPRSKMPKTKHRIRAGRSQRPQGLGSGPPLQRARSEEASLVTVSFPADKGWVCSLPSSASRQLRHV